MSTRAGQKTPMANAVCDPRQRPDAVLPNLTKADPLLIFSREQIGLIGMVHGSVWNDKKTLELFQAYHWPGNVRELQNVVERAIILCEGGTFAVDESWLVLASPRPAAVGDALASLADREKEMIEKALTDSGGQVSGPSGAAARLGIPRSTSPHPQSFQSFANGFRFAFIPSVVL